MLALAALPLVAQTPEPPAEEPLEQEQEYGAESQSSLQSETDPMAEESQEPLGDESESQSESEIGSEDELPRTASPLALIALLGGVGTAAGFGVRRLRVR